jgi:nicotinate-nucleotide adenylyltransferase
LESYLKRGFFGGSFDPIHNGHLHLALELFERHQLDEVFFCPTSQSPHKKNTPPQASKDHRRAMVTAAISPFPQFTLLDYELQKPASCYTIETMRTLKEEDPKVQYFLLLGEDAALSLPTWKEALELIKLAPPLVGSREKELLSELKGADAALIKMLKKGWTSIPRLEISSTWVRSRVNKGEYAGHLVPGKVWDYIQTQQLYVNQK